jgi:hypothetical protein
MSLFRSVALIRRSFAPGHQEKGRWIKGESSDTPFMGTAQPASGRVMELLDQGKRNTETISVVAPIELDFTTADSRSQRSGDIIIWEGREYEVQIAGKCNSHPAKIMHHWKLVATRVKEGEK